MKQNYVLESKITSQQRRYKQNKASSKKMLSEYSNRSIETFSSIERASHEEDQMKHEFKKVHKVILRNDKKYDISKITRSVEDLRTVFNR